MIACGRGGTPTNGSFLPRPVLSSPADRAQIRIAVVASLLTVWMVIIVSLLMSFIDYQSRLTRYLPGIRSSQIFDSARREIEFWEESQREDEIRPVLRKAEDDLQKAVKEAEFRISRICSLFGSEDAVVGSTDMRRVRCVNFLSRVPFDGTVSASTPEGDTSEFDGKWDAFSKTVLLGFAKEMASPDAASLSVDYLPSFSADIIRIARLNQEIFTDLELQINQLRNALLSSCVRKVLLMDGMAYQETLPPNCSVQAGYTPSASTLPSSTPPPVPPDAGHGVKATPSSVPPPPPDPSVSQAATNSGTPPVEVGKLPEPAEQPDVLAANPTATETPTSAPPTMVPPAGQGQPGAIPNTGQSSAKPEAMENQRRFELVKQLQMYNFMTGGLAQRLLLTNPDFLAIWVLVFGGALGSLLKILFWHIMPARNIKWSDLVIEPAQGLVCAVILFILFRSGVVVIAGTGNPSPEATPLSAFFVAFMAIGAGLMSDQVIRAFRNAASTVIGNDTAALPSRWAVGLEAAIKERQAAGSDISVEEIADRLGISPAKLNEWIACRSPVPFQYQDALRLVLGIPLHRLFTDLDPRSAVAPPATEANDEPPANGQPAPSPPNA